MAQANETFNKDERTTLIIALSLALTSNTRAVQKYRKDHKDGLANLIDDDNRKIRALIAKIDQAA